MPGIDELQNARNAALLARRRIEIRLRELFECLNRFVAAACVAVAGRSTRYDWAIEGLVIRSDSSSRGASCRPPRLSGRASA